MSSKTAMLGNANIDSSRLAGSNVSTLLNNGKGGNASTESNVSIPVVVNLGFSKETLSKQTAHPVSGRETLKLLQEKGFDKSPEGIEARQYVEDLNVEY